MLLDNPRPKDTEARVLRALLFVGAVFAPVGCLQVAGADDIVLTDCLAGTYVCEDDTLRKCDAEGNGWSDVKTCAVGMCDASKAQCAENCTPGTRHCSLDWKSLLVCSEDGMSWDPLECPVTCAGLGVFAACH
ncbi:MAG TPA: hypothetical protein PLI95_25180 [Polyangiaceae bacterium]|nr:hypothetical protein [Polyangiaceae bacterium]